MALSKLSPAQRGVLAGMLTGLVASLVVFALAILALPRSSRPVTTGGALRWLALMPLPLLLSVGLLAKHRFFTPEDIDGSGLTRGTRAAVLLQSVLQNSLEQTVLATVAYIGFAYTAPRSFLGVIPAAVLLFLTGRALFAKGYRSGAASRALGFALTFYPTVVLAVAGIVFFVAGFFQR